MMTDPKAFTGTVEPIVHLRAPISGRDCVLYQLELTRWQRLMLDGWRRRPWRETVGARFILRWGNVPLIVDATGAALHLPVRERHRMTTHGGGASAFCARLSRARNVTSLACLERRIDAGEMVTVSGTVTTVVDPAGHQSGYREPPTTTLIIAGTLRV